MSKPVKQPVDPRRVFASAEHFNRSMGILRSQMIGPEMVAVIAQPVMAMSAFTSELYLKCLLCIQSGNVPRGHHLKNLYSNLERSTRRRIEKRWDAYIPSQAEMYDFAEKELGHPIPRDLESALKMGALSFEEMRYLFEEGATQAQFMLMDLPQILQSVVLEMKPEWQGSLLFNPVPTKSVDRRNPQSFPFRPK
jgi:HEPN domain-containing protein